MKVAHYRSSTNRPHGYREEASRALVPVDRFTLEDSDVVVPVAGVDFGLFRIMLVGPLISYVTFGGLMSNDAPEHPGADTIEWLVDAYLRTLDFGGAP